VIGDPEWYKECKSLFPCGRRSHSQGFDYKLRVERVKARALLRSGFYDGTPVAHATTDMCAEQSRAGREVADGKKPAQGRVQAMAWQTLVSRRYQKDSALSRRRHAFLTSVGRGRRCHPVAPRFLNESATKSRFGVVRRRASKSCATHLRDPQNDPAKQKAESPMSVQLREVEYPTHVSARQSAAGAYRKNVAASSRVPRSHSGCRGER